MERGLSFSDGLSFFPMFRASNAGSAYKAPVLGCCSHGKFGDLLQICRATTFGSSIVYDCISIANEVVRLSAVGPEIHLTNV